MPQACTNQMVNTRLWGKTQWAANKSKNPILPPEEKIYIQKVVVKCLYYARAVDPTMLVSLGTLAAAQQKLTEYTKEAVYHLLHYCDTNPYTELKFHASNMTLRIHIDVSYLSELYARSHAGGHFY